jgi:hypothetical protein
MVSFESILRLGWAFARVTARNLVFRGAQLARFVGQYEPDGIVLFAPGESDVLRGASRCIACGRCDTEAAARGGFTALGPRGPMAFVLGVSRHSGEHDAAELTSEATPALLAALTRACPVSVPFAPLAGLVRRRGEALARVRGEGVHAAPSARDAGALEPNATSAS